MSEPLRVVVYLYESMPGEGAEAQRATVSAWAQERGLATAGATEYLDAGLSTARGVAKRARVRKKQAQLIRHARAGKLDAVVVASLSHAASSLSALWQFLAELHASGCALLAAQEDLDSTTPEGRQFLTYAHKFAQVEREMARQRARPGAEAVRRGRGKKAGRPLVSLALRERITHARLDHPEWGAARIAKDVGSNPSTVRRCLARRGLPVPAVAAGTSGGEAL